MARDPLSHYLSHHPCGPLSTAPKVIPVCSLCGLMSEAGRVSGEWLSQRTYMTTHRVNLSDCRFTYTCCPKCLAMPELKKPAFGRSMIITRLLAEGGRLNWLRRLTPSAT